MAMKKSDYITIFISVAFMMMLLSFQNCSKTSSASATPVHADSQIVHFMTSVKP